MCGISGFNWKNRRMVNRMNERLKHRGPDGRGVYADRKVTLGSTRLAIVDRSEKGSQPMTYGHKGREAVIIYNGEIYNFNDIRQALMEKGHVFVSDTDTEVVVASYAEWGPDCVKKFNGMWAFAIYDKEKGTLFLSRDRLGQKPLYYYFDKERFIFSSELKGIMEHPLDLKMNAEAVDLFLHFGFIPSPYSVFDRIFKLEPRQNIIFDLKRITIKKYYYYTAPSVNPSYDKKRLFNETDALLRDAIGLRLPSEVPFGVFLSGGLDSSYIVSTIVRHKLVDVLHTFSLEVEGRRNETKDIISFGGESRISRHTYSLAEKNAEQLLEQYARVFDEPYALSGPFPRLWLSQLAKSRISVALTGEGGDELFAGYDRYQAMLLTARMPIPVRKLLSLLSVVLPDSTNPKHKLRRLKRFLNAAALPLQDRYLKWIGIFDSTLKKKIYANDLLKQIADSRALDFIKTFMPMVKKNFTIDALLAADTLTYLPYDLLVKVDITSMANSLEARSPFLDQKLMEFAARLPVEYKMRNFVKKYILKKAVTGILPKENIVRKKMGFGMPVGNWFRGNMKEFLIETILSKRSCNRNYFNMSVISGMLQDHVKNKADYSLQLWSLLMLEMWHQRFID